MKANWIMYAAAYAQLLPPLLGVTIGQWTTPPRRWIVIWCLGMALADAVAVLATLRWGTNAAVPYIFLPLTGSVALWALSFWQTDQTSHLAMRLAIVPFVAISVLLSVFADDPGHFSLFAAPYHAVIMLVAASWTFVRRGMSGPGPLPRQDWFWVTLGLMLYFGAYTAIQPLLTYLLASDRADLIRAAFNVRAAVSILACLAITGGMLCPIRPTSFGGPSSPASSRSASSSAPSARRW